MNPNIPMVANLDQLWFLFECVRYYRGSKITFEEAKQRILTVLPSYWDRIKASIMVIPRLDHLLTALVAMEAYYRDNWTTFRHYEPPNDSVELEPRKTQMETNQMLPIISKTSSSFSKPTNLDLTLATATPRKETMETSALIKSPFTQLEENPDPSPASTSKP
ncbi:hypothetical protein AXF42_Ash000047 [Apostasia shenzhenica]|uniref:Uncharacterized protein n=1 Tax=Apostasia shenzhenica TaxID=1088818 RepID=A0A2I0AF80_9ASPA|nr:hypothetical protein AXF42_Ash000047 [Apostasia shenzhenica]